MLNALPHMKNKMDARIEQDIKDSMMESVDNVDVDNHSPFVWDAWQRTTQKMLTPAMYISQAWKVFATAIIQATSARIAQGISKKLISNAKYYDTNGYVCG